MDKVEDDDEDEDDQVNVDDSEEGSTGLDSKIKTNEGS